MSRLFLSFVLTPFLVCFLAGKAATEVEITAEPSHHLALENEYVRVFQVEAAPHASTLLHWHRHDYLFVTLGAADVSNEVVGKAPFEMKLKDGETRFAAGNFAHLARNLADTPFRNVTIELLQDDKLRQAASRWPEESGEMTFPGAHIKTLFVKDTVRVSEVDFEPGATVPKHHHDGPHLVVAVSDFELRSDVEGGASTPITMKTGDVRWVRGGFTHSVTNTGAKAARLVTVEF